MTLISAEDQFLLVAIMVGLVTFGLWSEKSQLGGKISGALIIILSAMLLSNLQLIPHRASIYVAVREWLVPIAIPMLLFRADLRQVFADIGPMLKAFIAAVIIITSAVILLSLTFDFGSFEAKFSGILVASYIGGALNFVATAQAVELTDMDHYVAAFTAITIGVVLFLSILSILPQIKFVRYLLPSKYISEESIKEQIEITNEGKVNVPFDITGLSAALTTSLVVCALSKFISQSLEIDSFYILIVTTISLLVASLCKPLVTHFNSEFRVGTFFLYLFFVTIGTAANFSTITELALPYIFMVCGSIILFFILIILFGSLLKLDLAELIIASNACILGPATAAAMAAGFGWKELITPGLLAGIIGYSIATFIGVIVTHILT